MPITAQGTLLPGAFLPGRSSDRRRVWAESQTDLPMELCAQAALLQQPVPHGLVGWALPSPSPSKPGGRGCGTVGGEAAWWAANTLGAKKAIWPWAHFLTHPLPSSCRF